MGDTIPLHFLRIGQIRVWVGGGKVLPACRPPPSSHFEGSAPRMSNGPVRDQVLAHWWNTTRRNNALGSRTRSGVEAAYTYDPDSSPLYSDTETKPRALHCLRTQGRAPTQGGDP